MAPAGVEVFEKSKDVALDVRKGVSPEKLLELIPEYDGIIVRSATKVTAEVIEAGEKLKAVGRAGVGVDNVDVKQASRRGIVVMNTPEANTISTAEHAVAMLFSLARRVPEADAFMKKGEWAKKKLKGVELFGKTLGVVGFGRIGRWVAKVCRTVGMHVIAYDPMVSDERVREAGVTPVSIDELFAKSDFITVHTPVNNETRNLISKETIAKMKDGVRFINCARGGIINEDDLCDAIESGKVAGAALDVYPKEPNENARLQKYPQIVLTPHIAASTDEAQSKVGVEIAAEMVEFLETGAISNAINAAPLGEEERRQILPFVELGEQVGSILAQLAHGKISSLSIEYDGELCSLDVSAITCAIVCGALSYNVDCVNQINARLISDERGLRVTESKCSRTRNYTNYISVEATREGGEPVRIGATIFGENRQHPRIVRIDHFHVDAVPEGYMLIAEHIDAPGVIGRIGTILGNAHVNINRMTCDRLKRGETNVGIFNTDQDIPEDVLAQIRTIEGVLEAHCIVL